MKCLSLVLLLLAATGVGVCAADANQPNAAVSGAATGPAAARAPASWTFMVYLDADNNLEEYGIDDFLQMAAAGSDANVQIVVLMDRVSGYDSRYDNWTGARYGLVNSGDTPSASWGAAWSPAEPNMGSGATLTAFINRATADYPATNYALVLWDHGGGWRARAPGGAVVKDVCWDDTSGGDCLYSKELQEAIDAATVNLTLVSFDACLMGMLEVAYQLRSTGASVMVASEETIPGTGWPYDTILGDLKANPSWSPAQFGTAIVDRYYASYGNDQTLAAIDLTQVAALATLVSTFGDTLSANWNSNVDACVTAAEAVKTKLDGGLIVHEHHGVDYAGSHGLAIYFPDALPDSAYSAANIAFAADHTWDTFLTTFGSSMHGSWVATARGNTTAYTDPDFRDLYDFCDHVAASGGVQRFGWAAIASPQYRNQAFAVTLTAKDAANSTYSGFTGTVNLSGVVPAATIGAGASTWDFPLQVYYEQVRTQVIYLQSEVGGAQTLAGLALNVASVPGLPLNNWTIRMKHTAASSFATAAWEGPASGWTTVYQANENVATTGWVNFLFATPFSYNGTDNLMIDFCYNNTSYNTNGLVRFSVPGGYRTVTGYSDYGYDGDPLDWSGTTVPNYYAYPARSAYVPNLKLLRTVSVTPSTTGNFSAGGWTGNVTIAEAPLTGVFLLANDGSGHSGSSNAFDLDTSPPEIALTGNGLEILDGDTSPDPSDDTDWGTVFVGSSHTHVFTVTNAGGGHLILTPPVTVTGSDFYVVSQPASANLAGGATTTFSVQFAPVGAAGPRTGTVTLVTNDGDEGTYTFAVAGTADTDPELDVRYGTTSIADGDATPSAAEGTDFGSVFASHNLDRTFTVRNLGTEDLTLGAVSIAGAAQFTVTAQPTSPVAPGASTTFTIRLTPTGAAPYAATVSLTNNDADESPFDFAVAGTGLDQPVLDVTYGAVPIADGDVSPSASEGTDFGTVPAGGVVTVTRVFTLANTGSQPLNIVNVTMGGTNAAEFVPTLGALVVAPAGTTTLTVVFDPAASGVRVATVNIASNNPGGDYNFTLLGNGKKKSSAAAGGGGGGGGGGCVLAAAEAGAVLGLWPWLAALLLSLGWRRRRG